MIKRFTDSLTCWMTQEQISVIMSEKIHWFSDSLSWMALEWISIITERFMNHLLTCWEEKDWISVINKRFNDSNPDLQNDRGVILSDSLSCWMAEEWISVINWKSQYTAEWHRTDSLLWPNDSLIQCPAEWHRSESQPSPKDSVSQSLTCGMGEKSMLVMTERFTDALTC